MSNDAFAVAAIVAVLLPTLYFLIASPTFLLAKLEDPVVTWLLRGLFSVHFRLICIGSVIGIIALVIAGRPIFTIGPIGIAVLAIAMRRWFLQNMDAELAARDAGDASAVRRLRKLHWRGMAYNAMQFVVIVASTPLIFATPS
ncbi:hypothetical protein [Bosea sp. PAMC 26642]|uniref:hypothetical protein n=1 Tax=Bosea sp. (strain PAMC 26642) TaxID=1792307 RepID=UPI0007703ECF|nr:hypothetical protein [Bosea sp. PAMC 26642]AMJ60408.1 hypothetical protein AXW83_08985 [Bosea sp. PAMC 26642]